MQNREARRIHVIGRLAPGVTLNQAQAEVTLISRHRLEDALRACGRSVTGKLGRRPVACA